MLTLNDERKDRIQNVLVEIRMLCYVMRTKRA